MIQLHKIFIICIILQSLFILYLLASPIVYSLTSPNETIVKVDQNSHYLLSPRVYTGLLAPKNYLIENFNPLKQELNDYIQTNSINASIYIVNLRNGASIGINSNQYYYPASLNKLPLAILIMQQVERGNLNLTTKLLITPEDRDSGWGSLYNTTTKEMRVDDLLERLLVESDNTAKNVLLRFVNNDDISNLEHYLDYFSNAEINNNLVSQKNNQQGNSTKSMLYVNTKSMYAIFSSLYLSSILEPDSSEYLLSLLSNSTFNMKSLASLPSTVTVAQKFGSGIAMGSPVFHSCGILYINESRIFYCIMTENVPQKEAPQHIGSMVHIMYEYIVNTRNSLDQVHGLKTK